MEKEHNKGWSSHSWGIWESPAPGRIIIYFFHHCWGRHALFIFFLANLSGFHCWSGSNCRRVGYKYQAEHTFISISSRMIWKMQGDGFYEVDSDLAYGQRAISLQQEIKAIWARQIHSAKAGWAYHPLSALAMRRMINPKTARNRILHTLWTGLWPLFTR